MSPFRKSLADFSHVLVNGRYDADLVRAHAQRGDAASRVINGGCPFLDWLDHPDSNRDSYAKRLGLDPSRRTVLISPSWRGLALAAERGVSYVEDVISALRGTDYNIVVKPHACSLNRIMAGGVDWKGKLGKIAAEGSARLDLTPDDRPAINAADVLITDISSRAFVFMLIGKPVVHYFPSESTMDPLDTQRLELLRRGSAVASSPSQISSLLRTTGEPGYRNPYAHEVASRFFSHFGNATDFTVSQITDLAGQEAGKLPLGLPPCDVAE